MSLLDPTLEKIFAEDKKLLEATNIPIVTVSASFKEDLKRLHGYSSSNSVSDVVFSRAHYSMALAVAMKAWKSKINPQKAWLIDPTNYVASKQWYNIALTEAVGKTIARNRVLKIFKDVIDAFGRKKLPILKGITPPLLHLTTRIHRPIISFHIAAGNLLASQGKTVVQIVTDPHVRDEYVTYAHLKKMFYCVFDANTKLEFLEKARFNNVDVDSSRIIITGPPIDPRIVAHRKKKIAWRSGPLKLCITTGGLGTNKNEILDAVEQLLPELRKRPFKYQLIVYTATHVDIYNEVIELAQKYRVAVGDIGDKDAKLRVLHHPQIMDANELLITHSFGWADGFITKPSGDMAYDAVAAGCFLLTLKEWGPWEENVRAIFEQKSISRKAELDHLVPQLEVLTSTHSKTRSWVEIAMHNALTIDPLFLYGSEKIIDIYEKVSQES